MQLTLKERTPPTIPPRMGYAIRLIDTAAIIRSADDEVFVRVYRRPDGSFTFEYLAWSRPNLGYDPNAHAWQRFGTATPVFCGEAEQAISVAREYARNEGIELQDSVEIYEPEPPQPLPEYPENPGIQQDFDLK